MKGDEGGGRVDFSHIGAIFGNIAIGERPSRWTFGRKVNLMQAKFKGLNDRSAVSLKFLEKSSLITRI